MPAKNTPFWSEFVPVLPATVWPEIFAEVPVPPDTASFSISTIIHEVDSENTRRRVWLA